jgi:predicted restriction endonuclease
MATAGRLSGLVIQALRHLGKAHVTTERIAHRALQNGLALSKNAHWLFDAGLWTVSDDFRVLVATDRFSESGENDCSLLQHMAGRRIRLPGSESLWPSRLYLTWHRENKFLLS